MKNFKSSFCLLFWLWLYQYQPKILLWRPQKTLCNSNYVVQVTFHTSTILTEHWNIYRLFVHSYCHRLQLIISNQLFNFIISKIQNFRFHDWVTECSANYCHHIGEQYFDSERMNELICCTGNTIDYSAQDHESDREYRVSRKESHHVAWNRTLWLMWNENLKETKWTWFSSTSSERATLIVPLMEFFIQREIVNLFHVHHLSTEGLQSVEYRVHEIASRMVVPPSLIIIIIYNLIHSIYLSSFHLMKSTHFPKTDCILHHYHWTCT